ncbi:RTC4-like domain-containing protein [Xylaria nigripes]|nr:RTC4-like domain-containing protein [Xylaria nigripes]
MVAPQPFLFPRRQRLGLTKSYNGGPPLTQVNGKSIQPPNSAKKPEVAPSVVMKDDQDLQYDPITAPPESSDDEVKNTFMGQAIQNSDQDSDEDYERQQTANIRKTTFDEFTLSKVPNTRPTGTVIRVPKRRKLFAPEKEQVSSLAGSKRLSEEDQPKGLGQSGKDLEVLRKKKKRPVTKYGSSNKATKNNASQLGSFTSLDDTTSPAQQPSFISQFKTVKTISPERSPSPRRPFKPKKLSSGSDESESPGPKFKDVPEPSLSPVLTPEKRCFRHTSPVYESEEKKLPRPAGPANGSRNSKVLQKSAKGRRPSPDPVAVELSQRPIFKMPELEDIGSFGDNDLLGAAESFGIQETDWDGLEIEEQESTKIPRCPICHQEVDRELLEKHSTHGKMNIKQQTAFCRLHKRKSAVDVGMNKGYPNIDWRILGDRCSAHQAFLQNILEGTQVSYYRNAMKDMVESGKNRTLLTSNDNFTPGYYGPRGLRVMTDFIMRTMSSVIRRRAVEDKLISARSYTGYVHIVLVPELAVRLIMEDMSVTEEQARDILTESAEIGELLHEEDRDIICAQDEEDVALKA